MIKHNGKVLRVEPGTPGVPRGMDHLAFQRACNRFLAKRGLATDASWRKTAWLFGKRRMAA